MTALVFLLVVYISFIFASETGYDQFSLLVSGNSPESIKNFVDACESNCLEEIADEICQQKSGVCTSQEFSRVFFEYIIPCNLITNQALARFYKPLSLAEGVLASGTSQLRRALVVSPAGRTAIIRIDSRQAPYIFMVYSAVYATSSHSREVISSFFCRFEHAPPPIRGWGAPILDNSLLFIDSDSKITAFKEDGLYYFLNKLDSTISTIPDSEPTKEMCIIIARYLLISLDWSNMRDNFGNGMLRDLFLMAVKYLDLFIGVTGRSTGSLYLYFDHPSLSCGTKHTLMSEDSDGIHDNLGLFTILSEKDWGSVRIQDANSILCFYNIRYQLAKDLVGKMGISCALCT